MILAYSRTFKLASKLKQKALSFFDRAFFIRASRSPLNFIAGCFIIFFVAIGVSMQAAKAEEGDLFKQQKLTSHLLVNLFLEKVAQNELIIFEKNISRSDLQPHQVSYVYNMADDSLLVRLCFTVQKKILVQNFEDYYVDMITAETDKDGNIIQIKTHVSPLDKEYPE